LPDKKLFKLFVEATKSTYEEYCKFKAEEEGLTFYIESVYQAALEQFNERVMNWFLSANRDPELEHALTQVLELAERNSPFHTLSCSNQLINLVPRIWQELILIQPV